MKTRLNSQSKNQNHSISTEPYIIWKLIGDGQPRLRKGLMFFPWYTSAGMWCP